MKKLKIITDSAADMTPQTAEQVTVVPMTVRFGEQEYVYGQDMDAHRFYERLVACDTLPTTSQPSPAAFADAFRAALEEAEQVVCLTISSRLSGTYQSAVIAAEEHEGRVFVVDSRTAALSEGILVELALRLADQGLTGEQLAARLEEEKGRVHILALLDTLEYLKKGGRISSAVALAGGLLNIKPVVTVEDGLVVLAGKARGSRQGNTLLVEKIRTAGGVDFEKPILLGYSGLSDQMLQKYIRDSADLWEGRVEALPSTVVGGVIGTHVGPNAVAVAFFAADGDKSCANS